MQRFRLLHHKFFEGRKSRHPEHGWPIYSWEVAHQFVIGHLVVVGVDIAQLHLVVTGSGNAFLYGIHLLHAIGGCGLVVAQCLEQTFAIGFIRLAHRLSLRVVVEVVVAVAQSESCLRNAHDVVVSIAEVGTCAPGIHHRVLAATVNLGRDALIFLAVLDGTNALNVRHDRL